MAVTTGELFKIQLDYEQTMQVGDLVHANWSAGSFGHYDGLAKVDKINEKSISVLLDEDVKRDGKVLYPKGHRINIPSTLDYKKWSGLQNLQPVDKMEDGGMMCRAYGILVKEVDKVIHHEEQGFCEPVSNAPVTAAEAVIAAANGETGQAAVLADGGSLEQLTVKDRLYKTDSGLGGKYTIKYVGKQENGLHKYVVTNPDFKGMELEVKEEDLQKDIFMITGAEAESAKKGTMDDGGSNGNAEHIYPNSIYDAYNKTQPAPLSHAAIDKVQFSDVRNKASETLAGGKSEFDKMYCDFLDTKMNPNRAGQMVTITDAPINEHVVEVFIKGGCDSFYPEDLTRMGFCFISGKTDCPYIFKAGKHELYRNNFLDRRLWLKKSKLAN